MGYWIDTGTNELKQWEQKLLSFLSDILSEEEINQYLEELQSDVKGFFERAVKGEGKLTGSVYNAISAVTQIRSLLAEIENPRPEPIPVEVAARFATLAFRAGLSLGMTAPGRRFEILEWENNKLRDDVNVAGKMAIRNLTGTACKARYAPLRDFKEKAASVAKIEWESGSRLMHHEMVKYLVDEYQDESGKHPFIYLPDKKSSPDRVLLKTLKGVAKEMGRFDLISGLRSVPKSA